MWEMALSGGGDKRSARSGEARFAVLARRLLDYYLHHLQAAESVIGQVKGSGNRPHFPSQAYNSWRREWGFRSSPSVSTTYGTKYPVFNVRFFGPASFLRYRYPY